MGGPDNRIFTYEECSPFLSYMSPNTGLKFCFLLSDKKGACSDLEGETTGKVIFK